MTRKKGKDGLVYAVKEENNPKGRIRILNRNNLLSYDEFPVFEEQRKEVKEPENSHLKQRQ